MGRFDWGVIAYAFPYMLDGLLVTVEISAIAMVLGLIIGVALGLASLSGVAPLRWAIRSYVYFVRGTPALVQVFLVYFALPVIGIELAPFWGGVAALTFNAGGYIAELVRAGVASVDPGQTEAALAIGMTTRQRLLHILLPQSLRRLTPPLTNEMITLIKGSSLLSVISITELTRSAQVIIAERFTPFELYAALAVFYLVIVSLLSLVSDQLEARLG